MIILSDTQSFNKIKNKLKRSKIKKWVFLSRDYSRLLLIEKALGLSVSRISTGVMLNEKARYLRKPVNDMFLDLAAKHHSLAWWGMRLSEKNTLASDVFLHICYLSMACDLIKEHEDICIISDSQALIGTLKNLHTDSEMITSVALKLKCIKSWVEPLFYFAKRITLSLIRGLEARIYAYKVTDKDINKNKKSILILTWADEKYFSDGVGNDRYFPTLAQWYRQKGYEVIIFPKLFNIQRTYKEVYRWFKQAKDNFLSEYVYYKLSDYLYPLAMYIKIKKMKLSFKDVAVNGLAVGNILHEHQDYDYSYESIMHYRLVKRLTQNGLKPSMYIDSYDNLLPQKIFRLGLRDYSPGTKIASYQHAPFFPNLLCMFIAGQEMDYAPDTLVCSSKTMRDIVVDGGFPRERTVLVPALRYRFLHSIDREDLKGYNKQLESVAVIFPMEINLAKELLIKIFGAFNDSKNIKVYLKPHPMFAKQALIGFLNVLGHGLPQHFIFSDKEMQSICKDVECAILMATSSLMEFNVLGVPYINVGSEISLNHDPTEWFTQCEDAVYTQEQIAQELERIIKGKRRERVRLSKDDIYEPVSDEAMNAFLLV